MMEHGTAAAVVHAQTRSATALSRRPGSVVHAVVQAVRRAVLVDAISIVGVVISVAVITPPVIIVTNTSRAAIGIAIGLRIF